MDQRYRVVFLGLDENLETFYHRMARLGVSTPVVEQMLKSAPIVLKTDMALSEAQKYAAAVQKAGGLVRIQNNGLSGRKTTGAGRHPIIEPLESFTMCPQCGFKQLRAAACMKCGFLLEPERTGRTHHHE
ncbi:MAG: hypothetical protein ACOWYE_12985 [Desulfatiglandales bacterium]